MSNQDSNRVAICLITNDKDEVLLGLRQEEGTWTIPGGHIHKKECPYSGCQRELKEETGLDPKDIQLVKVEYVREKDKMIYLFKVQIDSNQAIDVSGDPDEEFSFVGFKDPNDVREQLHIPIEENIALKYWINS